MIKLWDGDAIDGAESFAEIIYNRVTMDDVIRMYAPNPVPRHRRVPCPLHNGHDYNFSYTDSGFCCFVCGRTGGVIRFVMEMFNLDRDGAMRRINADFGLGLPFDRRISVREQARFNDTANRLRRQRNEIERIKAAEREHYWKLWDEWIALDKIIRRCKPTRPGEPCDPNWAYAVNRISYVQYLIDSTT